MKKCLFLLLALLSFSAQSAWVEGSVIGVPYYAPSENPPIAYCNAVAADDPTCPFDTWNERQIAGIPDDAKAAHVICKMIITNGNLTESATPDIHLRFRRALGQANQYSPDYVGQTVSPVGGSRSPFAAWVALENRKLEFHWTRSTPAEWPAHAAYGLTCYADAYVR